MHPGFVRELEKEVVRAVTGNNRAKRWRKKALECKRISTLPLTSSHTAPNQQGSLLEVQILSACPSPTSSETRSLGDS